MKKMSCIFVIILLLGLGAVNAESQYKEEDIRRSYIFDFNEDLEEKPTVIDIMFVYTENAKKRSGNIEEKIKRGMEKLGETMNNSNINIYFNKVYKLEVSYEETSKSYKGEDELRDIVGGEVENVHRKRDKYGADLVTFLTKSPYRGIAMQMISELGNPKEGYNLVGINPFFPKTFVHEIGHNLGAHHSRLQEKNQPKVNNIIYEYSTGWKWEYNNNIYGTIMTYAENRLAVFSNPNVEMKGNKTGSYDDKKEGTPADNARTIKNTKDVVSNYRVGGSNNFNVNVGICEDDKINIDVYGIRPKEEYIGKKIFMVESNKEGLLFKGEVCVSGLGFNVEDVEVFESGKHILKLNLEGIDRTKFKEIYVDK